MENAANVWSAANEESFKLRGRKLISTGNLGGRVGAQGSQYSALTTEVLYPFQDLPIVVSLPVSQWQRPFPPERERRHSPHDRHPPAKQLLQGLFNRCRQFQRCSLDFIR